MTLLIHVIGFEGPLPDSPAWRFLTCRPCELPRLAGRTLLLGEAALRTCKPGVVREWRGAGCRRVLLALGTCEASMLEGWLNDGAIRLVPIDRLGESLRQLAASDTMSGRHWPLRPSDWLAGCAGLDAPPRDSLAHDLVAALEHHRPLHRTRRWAAACGVSYKRLRAELDDALALRPAEVAQLFVLAQTEHADAAGIDRFSTARMLGFAGESELAHCLQRGRRVRQLLRKQAASTEEQSVEN